MVTLLSWLKLGKEMGTNAGIMLELGTLTPRVKGSYTSGLRFSTAKKWAWSLLWAGALRGGRAL